MSINSYFINCCFFPAFNKKELQKYKTFGFRSRSRVRKTCNCTFTYQHLTVNWNENKHCQKCYGYGFLIICNLYFLENWMRVVKLFLSNRDTCKSTRSQPYILVLYCSMLACKILLKKLVNNISNTNRVHALYFSSTNIPKN